MIIAEKLQDICEALYFKKTGVHSADYKVVIPNVMNDVFDFFFPIFDENYRSVFENKVIKNFYTRRLCNRDYAKWKLWLDTKLNLIMPYYNQLYSSTTLELNPLYNFVIEVAHQDSGGDTLESSVTHENDISHGETTQSKVTNEKTGKDTTDNTSSNKNVNKYNDTPQGRLTEIENGTYLTEATIDTNSGTDKSVVEYGNKNDSKEQKVVTGKNVDKGTQNKNETLTTDRQYTENVLGRKDVSDAELLMKFRESFINIDKMVMEELNELFDCMFYPSDYC